MKIALLIAAIALLAPACGDASAVGEVRGWADRACACRDAVCAAKVREEFSQWVETQRAVRGSRTERVAIEEAARRLFKCVDERGAAGPSPGASAGAGTDAELEPAPTTPEPAEAPNQKPGVED